MKVLLDGLVGEAKRIPYTVIAVVCLYIAMLCYVIPAVGLTNVTASAFERLSTRFTALELSLKLASARNLVVSLDGQVFSLEQEQRRAERAGMPLSDVVLQQLRKLQSERAIAEAELEALIRRSAEETPR